MDEEQVEPLVHVLRRPKHADPVLAHLGMEALVPDVAHAVHCELCLALAEQDGFHLDPALARLLVRRRVPRQLLPPKVVDEPARRQHVERAEGTLGSGPLRVVVVPVDAEDGERDVVVDVFVVDGREAEEGKEKGYTSRLSMEYSTALGRMPIARLTCIPTAGRRQRR